MNWERGKVGELQQTVNLSPFGLVGSNPSTPTWTVSSAVERLLYTQLVGGSIPSLSTILGLSRKRSRLSVGCGFPRAVAGKLLTILGGVAHLVEQDLCKVKVAGSSPVTSI